MSCSVAGRKDELHAVVVIASAATAAFTTTAAAAIAAAAVKARLYSRDAADADAAADVAPGGGMLAAGAGRRHHGASAQPPGALTLQLHLHILRRSIDLLGGGRNEGAASVITRVRRSASKIKLLVIAHAANVSCALLPASPEATISAAGCQSLSSTAQCPYEATSSPWHAGCAGPCSVPPTWPRPRRHPLKPKCSVSTRQQLEKLKCAFRRCRLRTVSRKSNVRAPLCTLLHGTTCSRPNLFLTCASGR